MGDDLRLAEMEVMARADRDEIRRLKNENARLRAEIAKMRRDWDDQFMRQQQMIGELCRAVAAAKGE